MELTAMKVKKGKKNVESKFKNDLKQVQDQYLDYPYPYRNPEDDKTRILRMQGDFLSEINHFLYKGKKDFNGFRVLVAGGGTGDSTVWIAKQLMDFKNTEVVNIDFSKTSMDIAKKRAEYQGVTNVTWIEDSILNIPKLGLGKFDLFNCIGVLHHLQDPNLGLKILSDALKADGSGHMMVYAQYGRTGVYQIQELLRMVNRNTKTMQEEVKNAWEIINHLPESNWYMKHQALLQDHRNFGDVGLYDLFLHKQDRAYTIPQLYDFVEGAGMNIISYTSPYVRACLNINSYLPESTLKTQLMSFDDKTREAMCEIICGKIIKHDIHISKQTQTIADLYDLDNVLFIHNANDFCKSAVDLINEKRNEVMNKLLTLEVNDGHQNKMNIVLMICPSTEYFFKHLGESKLSLGELFDAVRKDMNSDISNEQLLKESMNNIKTLETVGVLFARHKSIPEFLNYL